MRVNFKKCVLVFLTISGVVALSGCSSGESADGAIVPAPIASNGAPTISGSPAGAVQMGETYSFTPSASDPEGDTLTFSVQNLPLWAAFDAATGGLSGSPTLGDIGVYDGVTISVTDGANSASLAAYSITVNQISLGSATLSWTAPTQNEDGTALVDLVGYKIYYGTTAGSYASFIQIDNPGISTYVVENLTPATYYFVSTAFNTNGVESAFSNEAVKVVN